MHKVDTKENKLTFANCDRRALVWATTSWEDNIVIRESTVSWDRWIET